MQSPSQIGNARRAERVLLPALIELRSERGDEALTADGLDVSPSGVAVRAAFVPEVGTRLFLAFRCPPEDDAVHALAEVVWATWDGPRSGSFGMRFLELDTKSATAIRRFVAPGDTQAKEPEPPRAATMRIDGLGAPIEADVRLYDQACIVLEQELSFLRLGRGIEVDLPGRGKERGRIASIELRQGPLDTPTLVFGVLLDEQRNEATTHVTGEKSGEAPTARKEACVAAHEPLPESAALPEAPAPDLGVAARAAPPLPADESPRSEPRPISKRERDEPRVVKVEASRSAEPTVASQDESSEDDELERVLKSRTPAGLVLVGKLFAQSYAFLRISLLPGLVRGLRELTGRARTEESGEQGEGPARSLMILARLRASLAATFARVLKGMRKRRTTAAVPRVQRSAVSPRPQQRGEPAPVSKNRRLLTVSLAVLGMGLGVYALAPRSGADRLRVPRAEPRALPPSSAPSFAEPSAAPLAESTLPPASPVQVSSHEPKPAEQLAPSAPARVETRASLPVQEPEPVEPSSAIARFGEASVPNGRVFVLRMSGPVKSLEGETREDGFSVRIPGRLALDRASPIATSHRAIARALILNRGEYAELTVDFLPGMRPKYQVAAKDSSIEVTLERL